MPPHDHDNDHIREHRVSVLLRIGVAASGVLLLLGFVLYAAQPVWYDMLDATVMWGRLLSGDGISLMNPFIYLYSGLFLLMLTPIARVAMTAWLFALEHDRRYALISFAVLLILSVSVALSFLLA